MSRAKTVLLAGLGLGLLVVCVVLVRAEEKPPGLDEETLNRAGLKADDASLLAFIRERTGPDEDLRTIDRIIEQLGDAEAERREEASRKLAVLGVLALPKLRHAAGDNDPERAARAKRRIEDISHPTWQVPASAVRLLLRRKPAGTGVALYKYLPFAQCEETEEDIWFGLDDLAARDDKLREALADGLKDGVPARRALAACVLGHVGSGEQRDLVRGLLGDKDPAVRLRAAQGLLAGKDKRGVPTLIALLEDGPVEAAWQAEELLVWASGKDSPGPFVGAGGPDARKKARLAWEGWWAREGKALDPAKFNEGHRRPGLVLIAEDHRFIDKRGNRVGGRVWLTGCDGEARWEFFFQRQPEDVRLLAGPKVLLAETNGRSEQPGEDADYRVTERDLLGEVVWERKLGASPRACQRLPDGLTFIATGDAVTVDAGGKEVLRLAFDELKDGRACHQPLLHGMVVCGQREAVIGGWRALDPATGKELAKLPFGPGGRGPQPNLEGTPDGGFVVALPEEWKVAGAGPGDDYWSARVKGPVHAVGLRNGNVLAASNAPGGSVLEVNRAGDIQWEAFCLGKARRARACLGLVRVGLQAPRPEGFDLTQSLEYVLRGLKSGRADVRCRHARKLERMGKAGDHVAELIDASDHGDEGVQEVVTSVLGSLAWADVGPSLLKACEDARPRVRGTALWTLSRFKGKAEAREAIVKGLADDEVFVRYHAMAVLRGIDPDTPGVLPALVAELGRQERARGEMELRAIRMAAHVLASYGPKASPAVGELRKALAHHDLELREDAIGALGKIGPDAAVAVEEIHEALKGGDVQDKEMAYKLKGSAAWALGQFGSRAKAAVPTLTALCQDRKAEFYVRVLAVEALGNIGSEAKSSVPVLKMLLQDEDRKVRSAAAEALTKIDM